MYCGPSVYEILGWKDTEIIGMESIRDLVAGKPPYSRPRLSCLMGNLKGDDFASFLDVFRSSIQTNSEMLSHTHFRSKAPPRSLNLPLTLSSLEQRPVLFEIKGVPYFTDSGPQAFFAMCTPYPSKSLEM